MPKVIVIVMAQKKPAQGGLVERAGLAPCKLIGAISLGFDKLRVDVGDDVQDVRRAFMLQGTGDF